MHQHPDTSGSPGTPGTDRLRGEELAALVGPITRGTLLERCQMELVELSSEGGIMTMPVAGNIQPAGLLHGGATIALAESIASFAAILRAREVHGEGAQAVGTSVSAVHHRSAREGLVTATASLRHGGRQVAAYLVDVHDEAGTLLSTVTVSTMLLPPR
ncbi:hotdog fold thioesterase [Brachybacterium sp. J144]|uniref:PaaI family thioesterase n=1 Tax=Brachybacterium sp. J144 TaxID=3116487 RepID=UPI002E7864DC|nr:hotdog fold thioesterase [Brachybacterium sp. J144]MEE1651243.1 hotdog fold thioesterase [Brachybacterium sp. J144]